MADERPRSRRNAGAFLGPYGLIPVPTRNLSDEIPREPDDLEAERRGRGDGGRRRDGLLVRLRRAIRRAG